MSRWSRRKALTSLAAAYGSALVGGFLPQPARGGVQDPKVRKAVKRGLDWLARQQMHDGHFEAQGQYRCPMTGMAGIAFLCEGSTATQGEYSRVISRCADYLISRSRPNGLIGEPNDYRYTYGHGFGMLFLSQLLGEEEDAERREQLIEVLTKAVEFSGRAQTQSGGWGYVSAKDGNDFDEGSTTITQVQGLRGCRNAGIPVPKEVIAKAIRYIRDCTGSDGGVHYSSKNRSGGRPAITAAAIACLYNAGEEDNEYVPKLMEFCRKRLLDGNGDPNDAGHWHYTYYYYSQVMYRVGGKTWEDFRDKVFARILREQGSDGSWQGNIGGVYVSSINLTILQLENATLPIYTR